MAIECRSSLPGLSCQIGGALPLSRSVACGFSSSKSCQQTRCPWSLSLTLQQPRTTLLLPTLRPVSTGERLIMDSTDLLNSENDIAGRMEAASLADTPRPMGETGPAPRYTPFEPARQVAKAKDETAEKIRMNFEEFIERFVNQCLFLCRAAGAGGLSSTTTKRSIGDQIQRCVND